MISSETDILVIGAGPAGCAAALAAAKQGLRVVVLDRKERIEKPVRCGELVPRLMLGEWHVPDKAVAQTTDGIVLHLPSGEPRILRAPGAVLNREIFNQYLMDRSEHTGSKVLFGTELLEFKAGLATVRKSGTTGLVRCRVLIGADGPRSKTAGCAGLGRPDTFYALQEVVRLKSPISCAQLYFSKSYPLGYAWLFPKGDQANLGLAANWPKIRQAGLELELLKVRLQDEGILVPGPRISRVAGLVPVSGPLERIATEDVLLCGDAAGQVDPLTGAGILHALRCGTLAGESAASPPAFAAASAEEAQAGLIYQWMFQREYGAYFSRALSRRKELEVSWDRNLDEALIKAWRIKSKARTRYD